MYIHIYAYVHTYIYMRMYVYSEWRPKDIYTYICIPIYVYRATEYTPIGTHIHTYICLCMHIASGVIRPLKAQLSCYLF